MSDGQKQYDVYNDPNVAEAVLCRPVLSGLVQKVSQLLTAFPNHPTLMQVHVLCIVYLYLLAYKSNNFGQIFTLNVWGRRVDKSKKIIWSVDKWYVM